MEKQKRKNRRLVRFCCVLLGLSLPLFVLWDFLNNLATNLEQAFRWTAGDASLKWRELAAIWKAAR